jgi:alpha-L-rhamnosidase
MNHGSLVQQESAANDGSVDSAVTKVRFEHFQDLLGIGTTRPPLSWSFATECPGWYQAAYEIKLYGPGEHLREQTGRVESSESVLVP